MDPYLKLWTAETIEKRQLEKANPEAEILAWHHRLGRTRFPRSNTAQRHEIY
jgi:hypothetical protein